MTTFIETLNYTFHVVNCYTCGVRFAVDDQLYKRAVTDAIGALYCPACKEGSIWRESDDQKKIKQLERKLAWEAQEVARQKKAREQAEASLNATKGVVTRIKNRTASGVCPCCNRTFSQLSRHMATKHPDYTKFK